MQVVVGRIDGAPASKNEALMTALALVASRERQVLGELTLADLAGAAPRQRGKLRRLDYEGARSPKVVKTAPRECR